MRWRRTACGRWMEAAGSRRDASPRSPDEISFTGISIIAHCGSAAWRISPSTCSIRPHALIFRPSPTVSTLTSKITGTPSRSSFSSWDMSRNPGMSPVPLPSQGLSAHGCPPTPGTRRCTRTSSVRWGRKSRPTCSARSPTVSPTIPVQTRRLATRSTRRAGRAPPASRREPPKGFSRRMPATLAGRWLPDGWSPSRESRPGAGLRPATSGPSTDP